MLGSVDDPTSSFEITGDGQIDNGGVISLVPAQMGVAVLGHHFRVTFDTDDADVVMFAPSFDAGNRSLPVPTRSGSTFAGWFTEPDGAGTRITAASPLPGGSTGSTPEQFDLFASWQQLPTPPPVTDTDDPDGGDEGDGQGGGEDDSDGDGDSDIGGDRDSGGPVLPATR